MHDRPWHPFGEPIRSTAAHRRPTDRIGVVLVDDQELILDALSGALARDPAFDVVATAGSIGGLDALDVQRPDVFVVDYGLPDGTGVDACQVIHARWPHAAIVLASGDVPRDDLLACVRAGVDAYVPKGAHLAELALAIRTVHGHGVQLDKGLLDQIIEGLPVRGHPDAPVLSEPLTPRELGVLRLLAQGASTRSIAQQLHVTEGTVRTHVEAIRRKFGVRSKLEAVSAALRHRIVELQPA
jgi:DNA-binding NarL/FixJ family response regulator